MRPEDLLFSSSAPVQGQGYYSHFLRYGGGLYGWFLSFLKEHPNITLVEYPAATTGLQEISEASYSQTSG
jgi:hypothetical protein